MAVLTGWPTDGAEGSVSSEARWRKMARVWAPSGVVAGFAGELAPTLGSGVINVAAGAAWVDGHYCELVGPASETNSANGLLVVRFTPADNLFELVYRNGITTPTQTDATWELPIAQMIAGAISDRRFKSSPAPLGQLGYGQQVAVQTGITTTYVAVAGCTATVNNPFTVSRRWRISSQVRVQSATGVQAQTIQIRDGSTEIQKSIMYAATGDVLTHTPAAIVTATPGAHTYSLWAAASASTMSIDAAATSPSFILVEDIGPV